MDLKPIADPVLAALVAEAETAWSRVRAYLAACSDAPGHTGAIEPDWPDMPGHPDLIATDEAAARARRSLDTISRWCRTRGIGKMYGGRWRVSRHKLDALVSAKPE